jgi:hypothetical protein
VELLGVLVGDEMTGVGLGVGCDVEVDTCDVTTGCVLVIEGLTAVDPTDPPQNLCENRFVVVGVRKRHEMLPSISQREARSRTVTWHRQFCSSLAGEREQALVEAPKFWQ